MKDLKGLQELNRKIFISDRHHNHAFKYPHNRIHTTKYTLLTFLPKSLYIQFLRLANVYFLISAIISSIKEVSSVSPVTSIAPLVFVLFTSMFREAFEDWKRHKNDKLINNQSSILIGTRPKKHEVHLLWSDIHVGDIIKVSNNQEIPADMVILASSDEAGLAYVETASLDGERNLKLKQSKFEIKEYIKKNGIDAIKGALLVEGPNQKIHNFKGIIEVESLDSSIYLNYSNLLLRGTHLKNTDYVYGIVVYTGHDTKLLKNQGVFRNKRSLLEKQLNKYIFIIFIIQIIFCALLMILSVIFRNENYDGTNKITKLTYLVNSQGSDGEDRSGLVNALITFASFILLLNTMIPISLMVSLELAKWFQATWLEYDQLLWEGDDKMKVLNMLIHEDLARVEYIFADKTGTLTSNEMKFQFCSINGIIYSKEQLLDRSNVTPEHIEIPRGENEFRQFWLGIGICHDIVIDSRHLENPDPRARYQGSSPDEVELVSMAAEVNYVFEDKKAETYMLKIEGILREYRILAKIEFSSDRKRMSVIARDLETDKIFLFSKGADNMMLRRIREDTPEELLEKTNEHLDQFSKEGLRTLVTGYKEIDEEYFLKWYERYHDAILEQYNILTDPAEQNQLALLEDEIERDLILLGVTALEDKLQEGVPECISDLSKAGIKIWMLTGDKLETAENIGYATHLIAQDTKVFKVKTENIETTKAEYEKIAQEIKGLIAKRNGTLFETQGNHTTQRHNEVFKSFALIIDGEAITYTFNNEKLKTLFLDLIPQFRTVICCRSTPNQKAEVVTFVKTNLKKVTLAIGDGGNDVNMIQRADIGIGLFGKEGNQAAFASDYAFARFFFLWRLLLVHGRWFYIRTANFINFFFYKNLIFTLPQFWFALYSAYNGQSFWDDGFITCYNSIFTSVAPVYYAAQEQDINPRENETIRKAMPYVYAEFRDKKRLFSPSKFLFWWATGVVHSVIVYFFAKWATEGPVNSSGLTFDLWLQSITAFAGTIITVFGVIIMGTHLFQFMTLVCYGIGTLLLYFPVGSMIIDSMDSYTGDLLFDALGTGKFWMTSILIVATCCLLLYVVKQYLCFFSPSLADLLQRDRNKRWKKQSNNLKVIDISTENKLLEPAGKFQFNGRIMMDGWFAPGVHQRMVTNHH